MNDTKKIGSGSGGSNGNGEFERDLALSSRAYKAIDDDLPPQSMDDAIRAAARRAVKSKPRAAGKSWVSRWSAPISVAALVVLTVSVVFTGLDEQPDIAPAPVKKIAMPKSAAPTAERQGTPAAPARGEADMALRTAPAPASAAGSVQPAQSVEKKARIEKQSTAPRDQLTESRLQDMDRRRSDAVDSTASTAAPSLKEKRDGVAFNAPPPPAAPAVAAPTFAAPAKPLAKDAPTFASEPPPAQLARSQENTGVAIAESAKREMVQAGQSQPALAAGAALGSARNEVAALAAKKSINAATPAAAPGARSQMLADKTESPDVWLKRILELKQHGKTREFEAELAQFRKRYPDFVLPEELKTTK